MIKLKKLKKISPIVHTIKRGVTLIILASFLLGVFHPTGLNIVNSYCCSGAKSCPAHCDPMDCSTPAFPVHHYLPCFAQIHVHWVGDAIWPCDSLPPASPFAFSLSQPTESFPIVSNAWIVYWMSQLRNSACSIRVWEVPGVASLSTTGSRERWYSVKVMVCWMTPSHWVCQSNAFFKHNPWSRLSCLWVNTQVSYNTIIFSVL